MSAFESNETAQFRFHMCMAFFWILCMFIVPFIGGFKHQIAALLIMEVSLYANFATEYGSATTQGAVIRKK